MTVCVIGSDAAKDELLSNGTVAAQTVQFVNDLQDIVATDELFAVIDLLFTDDAERTASLRQIPASVIIINSVSTTLGDLPDNFVRINGWPGFLNRHIVEAACKNDHIKQAAAQVISVFNKTTEWVPDIPGFITTRIVCAIINEAYFSLEEKVSSKEDIDIAMKMGTNYPYGPFEWGDKIGLKNVYDLLEILGKNEKRYEPALLLKRTALI